MSETNEPAPPARRNPLIWIVLVVVGLILFVFLGGDRGSMPEQVEIEKSVDDDNQQDESSMANTAPVEAETGERGLADGESVLQDDAAVETVGSIDRSLLVPPGMRARQYIEKLREVGKPYPLSQVFEKAQRFQFDGNLADAHLLFFFAARENHLPAMMTMAEISDPLYFRAADSLLDRADAIQAWKWYRKAADLGQPGAAERLAELGDWAETAAASGDSEARQLLLNMQ